MKILKNKRTTYSYKRKIRFIFLIIFLLFSIFVLAVNFIFYHALSQQEYRENHEKVLSVGKSIDSQFQKIEFFSYSIIANNQIQNLLPQINDTHTDSIKSRQIQGQVRDAVDYLQSAYENISTTYLVDNNQNSLTLSFANKKNFFAGKSVADFVNKSSTTPEGHWYFSSEGNQALFVRSIYSSTTFSKIGTMLLLVNTSFIRNAIQENQVFTDDDLFFIKYQDKAYDLSAMSHNSQTIQKYLAGLPESNHYTFTRLGSKPYFVAANAFSNGIQFIALLPRSEVINTVINFELIFGLLLILVTIITFFLANYSIQSIVQPILSLASEMRSFKNNKGNIHRYLDIGQRSDRYMKRLDEVGELYRGFTELTGQIDLLIKDNYEAKILKQEMEFNSLQSQLDPHFLYNTLDSINWLAISKNEPQISQMISSLATLFRLKISNQKQLTTLQEELDLIHAYIDIQQFRFQERLIFTQDVQPETLALLIPKLILQPVIENSIKYGLERMDSPCSIDLVVKFDKAYLSLTVSDNGPGFEKPSASKQKSTGIGLANIQKRLARTYHDQAKFIIKSSSTLGTMVCILIPCSTLTGGENDNENSNSN